MKNERINPGVFADATNDFVFKRIFGSEQYKAATIGLLNSVLDRKDDPILDVTFINVEIPGLTAEDRKVVVDVACISDHDERFIVEMQCITHSHFEERMVLYASALITHTAEKRGRWSFRLNPTHIIAILNDKYPHESPDRDSSDVYFSKYICRSEEIGRALHGSPAFYFLELGRFHKTPDQFDNETDNWLYLLKEAKFLEDIPDMLKDTPAFDAFFDASKTAAFSKEERRQYDKDMITNEDIEWIKIDAREEGLKAGKAEGLAEGKAKGQEEASIEIARAMLKAGEPIEKITSYTGLSKETVQGLLSS